MECPTIRLMNVKELISGYSLALMVLKKIKLFLKISWFILNDARTWRVCRDQVPQTGPKMGCTELSKWVSEKVTQTRLLILQIFN